MRRSLSMSIISPFLLAIKQLFSSFIANFKLLLSNMSSLMPSLTILVFLFLFSFYSGINFFSDCRFPLKSLSA